MSCTGHPRRHRPTGAPWALPNSFPPSPFFYPFLSSDSLVKEKDIHVALENVDTSVRVRRQMGDGW